ncbi:MAG: hypothetical protein NUV54_00045 [Candidatus Taylorbacteria bacterium]|nr:hypothetical protein [Candidatus Taylorbacteria bacterium]
MQFVPNKIISLVVLTSFIAVIFFSFPMMTGAIDGSMPGGCPFSTVGTSLCPLDTVAMTIHHISSYQSFLTVSVYSSFISVLTSLFLLAVAFLVLFVGPPLYNNLARAVLVSDSPPIDFKGRKITRWLSLFENSPSF